MDNRDLDEYIYEVTKNPKVKTEIERQYCKMDKQIDKDHRCKVLARWGRELLYSLAILAVIFAYLLTPGC